MAAGKRLPPNVFNVRAYGAVGDGVSNDLPAIHHAVAACTAAGGGVVYFPPGIYNGPRRAPRPFSLIEAFSK